eukprot:XP_014050346.1 PREDICTED: nef-associated protein 1 isoform X1 [Salmo salar]
MSATCNCTEHVNKLNQQISVMRKEIKNLRQLLDSAVRSHRKHMTSLQSALTHIGQSRSPKSQPRPQADLETQNSLEKGTIQTVPIGYISSCFSVKNGTPRQPTICGPSRATLQIQQSVFNNPEHSLVGLDNYSHVWVIFLFHKNGHLSYKAKVKPPRLNGQRVGVYSTRSPHRPNALGLTLAKLDRVTGDTLHLSEIDMIEGTPVLDIKPYISDYDSPHSRLDIDTDTYDSGVQPESTSVPSEEGTTSVPSEEGTTSVPSEEGTTSVPSEEGTTSVPSEEGTTSVPSEEGTTSVPSEEGTTSVPSEEGTTSVPSEEGTTSVPSEEGTTSVPSEEGTTSVPSEEGTTSVPSEERTTSVPSEEGTTSVPSEERTTSVPSEEGTTSVPSEEGTTSVPSEEGTTSVPSEEGTTSVPSEEGTTSVETLHSDSVASFSCTVDPQLDLGVERQDSHNADPRILHSKDKSKVHILRPGDASSSSASKTLGKDLTTVLGELKAYISEGDDCLTLGSSVGKSQASDGPNAKPLEPVEDSARPCYDEEAYSTIAGWIREPPVTSLEVRFTPHAERELGEFLAPISAESRDRPRFRFLRGPKEAAAAIRGVLSADPRSVYRRSRCKDRLFFFTLDTADITCWFGQGFAEVLRVRLVAVGKELAS